MEQRLTEAAQSGDINTLYALLRKNPNLLEHISDIPFVDTPLHIAAGLGHTHFALEIASLRPSFGKKLNPDGLSAIHLAILNGHTDTVKRLISIDAELIRVRGKGGVTPLHCAVEMENADLLAEFLCACPKSIEDLNGRCESAVHVAVSNRRFGALKVMLGWLQRTCREEVLNWKDESGNTVLHIAAFTNEPQVVKLLVHKVNKDAKNLEGLTALDIVLGLPREVDNREVLDILNRTRALRGSSVPDAKTLSEFLKSREELGDKLCRYFEYLQRGLSVDMRNLVLVVAVLIATATYQAVLSPPGGVRQVDSSTYIDATIAGKVVMSKYMFNRFIIMNSIAFTASIGAIFCVLEITAYTMLLHLPLIFLFCSYIISVRAIAPPSDNFSPHFTNLILLFLFSFALYFRLTIFAIEKGVFRLLKGKNDPRHHIRMRRRVVGW